MIDALAPWLPVLVMAAPGIACLLISAAWWIRHPLPEVPVARLTAVAFTIASLAAAGACGTLAWKGVTELRVPLASWFEVSGYVFHWDLVLDRLSAPFSLFGAVLVGLVGAFSRRYLHRERGYGMFYLHLCLLGTGFQLVVLAGNLDLVFLGWELVGFASALLIAFFHERPVPVKNAWRAFVTYRFCDIGLLAAAVWAHHSSGNSDFAKAGTYWWGLVPPEHARDGLIVGLLLLWASLGKSAQVPLGGWLPRAMEGPTPSSAIFYGALSIHLGPYLLLRAAPLLDASPALAGTVAAIGFLTACHATFVGRVQTEIKSALAYSSMAQAGLIFMEIGLGLRLFALLHILGHAALRTLQILRSPSVIQERVELERTLGSILPRVGGHLERIVPRRLQPWLWRLASERGYFDSWLMDYLLAPVRGLAAVLERIDSAWVRLLAGPPAPGGDPASKGHP